MKARVRLRALSLLLLFLLPSVSSSPIETVISSIVRRAGTPDTIYPTVCPPACDDLFHAVESVHNSSLTTSCSCICPPGAPVYLNTAGYCIDKLDECRYNIAFSFDNDTRLTETIPVVSLPAQNGILLPRATILWNESGITVLETGGVNCSITGAFFDNIEHRWRSTSRRALFELVTMSGKTEVVFRGSDMEAASLTGSVVQLKVSCDGYLPDEHCISFRVAGVTGVVPSLLSHSSTHPDGVVIICVVVLLLLAFVLFCCVWNLCWRLKKRRLISDIQMQFLYQFKQQQEAHKMAAAQLAAQMSLSSEYGMDGSPQMQPPPRRRMVFSPEYLEPECMVSPPPVAEQYLMDLRKMVEIQRDRIRMRRFVPILITINETAEEPAAPPVALSVHQVDDGELSQDSQDSPRSESKSVDSGRESRDDSDESPAEEDEGAEPILRNLGAGGGSVRSIVSGFESRAASKSSQLPAPTSKRTIPAPRTRTQIPSASRPPVSQIPTLIGQASPRPAPRGLVLAESISELPTLPSTTPPMQRIKEPSKSVRARKGYNTVFPADPMLQKSLPRRAKRTGIPVATTHSPSDIPPV